MLHALNIYSTFAIVLVDVPPVCIAMAQYSARTLCAVSHSMKFKSLSSPSQTLRSRSEAVTQRVFESPAGFMVPNEGSSGKLEWLSKISSGSCLLAVIDADASDLASG
jgi:hypothetical protein